MQLLSLNTLSVPIFQDSTTPSQNWFWTWLFIGIAGSATVLAVPLYVLVPVAYSSTTVFVAAAAPAFVVLQAAGMALKRGNEKVL